MVLEMMVSVADGEPVALPPDPYVFIRTGWMPDWSEACRADASAWASAALVLGCTVPGGEL
jgi:hypothetical protein